ncbi:MAG: hypothetical protein MUC38_00265 [Cyclobacteriaceae bacterium]|jgi:hypothetical protein|nr:hypothetical protein [Cyclobacteriaceae bacterium]
MTDLEERFIRFWGEKRKRGKWHYSFRHGVLLFAWPAFVLAEFFKYCTRPADYAHDPQRLLVGWLIYTSLGFLTFGLLMWSTQEKRYQKLRARQPNEPADNK